MVSFFRVAVVLAGVLVTGLGGASADAIAAGGRVQVSYEGPSDAQLRPIYEGLKRRQVLERLQAFLSPLRLPKDLKVQTAQCGADTKRYQPDGPATVCYELVAHVTAEALKNTADRREQVIIIDGTFVEAVLHEVAYAVFDILQVPVWGRKDDAADRLAALLMLQFDEQVAVTTIIGTAKLFEMTNHTWTGTDFASETSPEAQRFYNYLCVAYGGDPLTFRFLAPRPGPSALPRLTAHRAQRCGREFSQVQHAFDLRIMPFVDPDLVVKVRASQWLRPDEIGSQGDGK